jgi:DNA-binding MarR family transcriptional regulator
MKNPLRTYLENVFGGDIAITTRQEMPLPFYLMDNFDFCEIEVFGQRFLAMIDKALEGKKTDTPPVLLAKQIKMVADKTDLPVVYVAEAIPAYSRDRLIKQGIQFISPHNQMFIPSLGLDLREYLRKAPNRKGSAGKYLKPAAQAALLYLLTKLRDGTRHITDIAHDLHYTKMTISRVMDELEDAGLVETEVLGRAKMIALKGNPRDVWERALKRMQTPVRHTYRVRDRNDVMEYPLAGETALAYQTDLNEPLAITIAVANEDIKRLGFEIVPDGEVYVEAWRYDPNLFSENGMTHPLTLYLRFRDDHDERIQIALEKLIEAYPW